MKDEKKVNKEEEAKKEVQPEENGTKLTDEELAQVTGGGRERNELDESSGASVPAPWVVKRVPALKSEERGVRSCGVALQQI